MIKVNPTEITNYNRGDAELELFILFCMCVAGKSAAQQSVKLEKWYEGRRFYWLTPLQYVNYLDSFDGNKLEDSLREVKMGKYNLLVKGFRQVRDLDLRTCTMEDLLDIHGIALKTANFFLTHSREDYNYPILDTHILQWLEEQGVADVPKRSPQKVNVYSQLANAFISLAASQGMTVADLDLQIWKSKAK